jgi:23S rRNA (cytosine1962-C5)-methyltransferase
MSTDKGTAVVSAKGAARWAAGHPWIYRTDVLQAPRGDPGIVRVCDRRGAFLGQALFSPRSEIRLRLLAATDAAIDRDWWRAHIAAAAARRDGIPATAWRVVHADGDGLPSLVVDRYGPYVVAQLLSAGIESVRDDVVAGIRAALAPDAILLRNDAAVRRHEGLPLEVVPVVGAVPEEIEVVEHGIRYLAAPHHGQKTGAFLDQRDNRVLVAAHTRSGGRALDVFTYHGSFALHLARRAAAVVAVDQSADALARGSRNAALNGLANITWHEANAFELLRALERQGERFDTIVLDPPAFAKTRASVARALAGYKEINLRAMRLLEPGGVLFTCSCSYHVHRADFLEMLGAASRDSGRRVELLRMTGASGDHPEILNVPETGYLKGTLVRAVD